MRLAAMLVTSLFMVAPPGQVQAQEPEQLRGYPAWARALVNADVPVILVSRRLQDVAALLTRDVPIRRGMA